ncbi:MAG: OB-fold domain-containing protein [Sphingobium sp.]
MTKPIPVPSDLSAPFWEAANDGKLVIQRCVACERFQHPPRLFCADCGSSELTFEPVSGRGKVRTFTIIHEARYDAYKALAPYALAVVELEEQPDLLMLSNLPDVPQGSIAIGLKVEVMFERLTADIALPQFGVSDNG